MGTRRVGLAQGRGWCAQLARPVILYGPDVEG